VLANGAISDRAAELAAEIGALPGVDVCAASLSGPDG
jgi:hypothetical protein